MNNIEVETTTSNCVLVNWDNVNMVREITSHFGDKYREIYLANGSAIAVNDTIKSIQDRLSKSP